MISEFFDNFFGDKRNETPRSLLVNVKRDFENICFDSGAPDFIPIDKNVGEDLTKLTLENNKLETGTKYWWRVHYRDRNLQWSDWSDEIIISIKNKKK